MPVARYALVDADGLVDNLVLWDGVAYDEETNPSGWQPPEGFTPVLLADDVVVHIGERLDP